MRKRNEPCRSWKSDAWDQKSLLDYGVKVRHRGSGVSSGTGCKIMRNRAVEKSGQGHDLLLAQRAAIGAGKGRHHGVRFAEGDDGFPIFQTGRLLEGVQVRHGAVAVGGLVADAAIRDIKVLAKSLGPFVNM